jgi:hypothetical protein
LPYASKSGWLFLFVRRGGFLPAHEGLGFRRLISMKEHLREKNVIVLDKQDIFYYNSFEKSERRGVLA